MERNKRILKIAVCLLVALLSPHSVYAKEESSNITISYTPTKAYAKVELQVQVEGKGTVFEESGMMRQGTVIYELQDEDIKGFRVQADEGYEVKLIEFHDGYSSSNLLKDMKDNAINIAMKDRDATLLIRFEEKKNSNGQSSNSGSIDKNSQGNTIVSTGDSTRIERMLTILAGASLILILLLKKKKDEREEE